MLNLQGNRVQIVQNLDHLPNLIFLDLYNNHLSSCGGIDTQAPRLQILLLGRNQLTDLHGVEGLVDLDILDAHSNRIAHVRPEGLPLSRLSHLRILNLSDNALGVIPAAVAALPALAELNLRRNKITHTEGRALTGCPSLARLFLSSNQISSLDDVAPVFRLPALTELSLSGNPVAEDPGYVDDIQQRTKSSRAFALVGDAKKTRARPSSARPTRERERVDSGQGERRTRPMSARHPGGQRDRGDREALTPRRKSAPEPVAGPTDIAYPVTAPSRQYWRDIERGGSTGVAEEGSKYVVYSPFAEVRLCSAGRTSLARPLSVKAGTSVERSLSECKHQPFFDFAIYGPVSLACLPSLASSLTPFVASLLLGRSGPGIPAARLSSSGAVLLSGPVQDMPYHYPPAAPAKRETSAPVRRESSVPHPPSDSSSSSESSSSSDSSDSSDAEGSSSDDAHEDQEAEAPVSETPSQAKARRPLLVPKQEGVDTSGLFTQTHTVTALTLVHVPLFRTGGPPSKRTPPGLPSDCDQALSLVEATGVRSLRRLTLVHCNLCHLAELAVLLGPLRISELLIRDCPILSLKLLIPFIAYRFPSIERFNGRRITSKERSTAKVRFGPVASLFSKVSSQQRYRLLPVHLRSAVSPGQPTGQYAGLPPSRSGSNVDAPVRAMLDGCVVGDIRTRIIDSEISDALKTYETAGDQDSADLLRV
ncbi:hypothetical protein KIPB_002576 [Kipferlia bialata]|uniref:Uncharacterized protein n=1 Tax=Kipferlia bialata TaxID=797122 RepID=A0A9K3CT06_9EUKA|nr:hypothetical protein KIPB_000197 [Kipferlia bialata]GIQ81595.1 hypothetical protein KIPB_002576 [Kipferlia bialata]|eukprot:g197.t1